jgi:polygalacturonase
LQRFTTAYCPLPIAFDKKQHMKRLAGLLFLSIVTANLFAQQKTYDITAFGAKGDSSTNNTAFIQKAIDEAAANGGGRVLIPAGRFVTGVIQLRSGVELHVSAGQHQTQ